jgi:hypothetical protein
MSIERVEELKSKIADLKKRWPSHSVPSAMMAQLDELYRELACEENSGTSTPTLNVEPAKQ